MDLTLRNFRCYRGDHTFTFSQPLVCISGISGSGKTSILDAIVFALTGKGKNCATYPAAEEPYAVELALDGARIKRTKTSLVYSDAAGSVSDVIAQEKIHKMFGRLSFDGFLYSQLNNTQFLELAPREQLEMLEDILFGGEVDIKELKSKFNAEKRALDGVHKELAAKQSLMQEFLRKIGPIVKVQHAPVERALHVPVEHALRVRQAKHRLCFLRQRLSLHAMYAQKKLQIQRDIADLHARIAAAQLPVEHTLVLNRYTKEQVAYHIEAMEKLNRLGWQKYLGYTVDECGEEIETYRADERRLCASSGYNCPCCNARLCLEQEKLVQGEDLGSVDDLLAELGVETVADALKDVRRQIDIYSSYKEKRQVIDELKHDVLPIENAASVYRALVEREKSGVRVDILEEQLSAKQRYLEQLTRAAQDSGADLWSEHASEANELSQMLQNAELYEMRAKETTIRCEYETQLSELERGAQLCAARHQGLARASAVLAETEQQYLQDMIAHVVSETNRLLSEVANTQLTMGIEAASNGARKLRITFKGNYTYEMFSGGEKARINLCILLVLARLQNYKVLLLDEFTRFLDRDTAQRVLAMMRRNFGGQIIAVEHEKLVDDAQELVLSAT